MKTTANLLATVLIHLCWSAFLRKYIIILLSHKDKRDHSFKFLMVNFVHWLLHHLTYNHPKIVPSWPSWSKFIGSRSLYFLKSLLKVLFSLPPLFLSKLHQPECWQRRQWPGSRLTGGSAHSSNRWPVRMTQQRRRHQPDLGRLPYQHYSKSR